MHLAGHMRLADRVFETPALDASPTIFQGYLIDYSADKDDSGGCSCKTYDA
jgi:hypothetical protein